MRLTPTTRRAAVLVGAVLVWALSSPTFGGFTAKVVNNSSSEGTTSTMLTALDDTGPTVDCTSDPTRATPSGTEISSTQSLSCTGTTLPASVPSSGTSTKQVTLSASGGVSPASATYAGSSCGPVELADQSAASDPMLVRYGVSYAQSGPLTGGDSLGLDGSTALAASIVSSTPSTTFTEGIWFKTASGYDSGGSLIGFGSSPSTVSDISADKILSMTTAGKLNFAISTTVLGVTVTNNTLSTHTFNDGSWHLAVVSVSTTVGLVTSVNIYVDGASEGSSASLTLAGGYAGYWHVGWSPVSSGSAFLKGSLADAFVIDGTALSQAQANSLHSASDQSAWSTDLDSSHDNATKSWTLDDAGTTAYTGTLNGHLPCSEVAIAIGGTSFCIYPNSASACSGTFDTTRAFAGTGGLVAAGNESFTATSIGSNSTITTTVGRATTSGGTGSNAYDATWMPGLQLYVPTTLTEKLSASSPWSTTLTWSSTSQQVTA